MTSELIAEGKVIMRNLREQVEADWMRYDQPADLKPRRAATSCSCATGIASREQP
jgi:hypothetical protein